MHRVENHVQETGDDDDYDDGDDDDVVNVSYIMIIHIMERMIMS